MKESDYKKAVKAQYETWERVTPPLLMRRIREEVAEAKRKTEHLRRQG